MQTSLPAIVLGLFAAALSAGVVARAATLTTSPAGLTARTVPATVPVTTCTLAASAADTYVDASQPLTAFGTATTLHVRTYLVSNKRALVRFNVASCSIPVAARVTTGSLSLFLTTAPPTTRTYDVYRVNTAWTETLTWNGQTAAGFAAAAATTSFATGTTPGVTLTTNVLPDVSAFVAGTASNNGWRVRDRTEDSFTTTEGQFGSRENATAGQRPSLVVTYYP